MLNRLTIELLTATFTALALGCEVPDDGTDPDALAQAGPGLDAGLVTPLRGDGGARDGGRLVDATVPRSASSPEFSFDITANGTGCPKGTWAREWTDDFERIATTFSAYDVTVEAGKRFASKDCNSTYEMHAKEPLQFALFEVGAEGYAFLEKGVNGFYSADFFFQDTSHPSEAGKHVRTDLTGPVDRSFRLRETVRQADLVWTPCMTDARLQVVTRVGLQKQQDEGAGLIRVSEMRGPVFTYRKCPIPAP